MSGLRQGCDVSMVVQYVYGWSRKRGKCRVLGRGVELVGWEGDVWRVNQLLYADDTVLIGNSRENLQRLMDEFDIVCIR